MVIAVLLRCNHCKKRHGSIFPEHLHCRGAHTQAPLVSPDNRFSESGESWYFWQPDSSPNFCCVLADPSSVQWLQPGGNCLAASYTENGADWLVLVQQVGIVPWPIAEAQGSGNQRAPLGYEPPDRLLADIARDQNLGIGSARGTSHFLWTSPTQGSAPARVTALQMGPSGTAPPAAPGFPENAGVASLGARALGLSPGTVPPDASHMHCIQYIRYIRGL